MTTITQEYNDLFLNNKYTKWYFDIISNPDNTSDYFENHHIIPRSMNGSHDASNIAKLSLRQHYICHLLLPKMCKSQFHMYKMIYAFTMISKTRNHEFYRNSRMYDIYKKRLKNTTRKYYYNPETKDATCIFEGDIPPKGYIMQGAPKSEEHKRKIGQGNLGKDKTKMAEDYNLRKWFTNDKTGESVFVHEENAPVGEEWRRGTKCKGRKYKSFIMYYDPITLKHHAVYEEQVPDETWIKGRYWSEEQKQIMKERAKTCSRNNEHNIGRKSYYDPVTLEQRNFKETDIIPDGWIAGRSPKYIEQQKGFTQTEHQRKTVSDMMAKTFEITFPDGHKEIVTNLSKWCKEHNLGIYKVRYGKDWKAVEIKLSDTIDNRSYT